MGAIEDYKSVQDSLKFGSQMDSKLGNMKESLTLAFKLVSLNIDEYETTHDLNRLLLNMAYTAAYMRKLDVITGEAMIRTIWIGVCNQIDMIISSYASQSTLRSVIHHLIQLPPEIEKSDSHVKTRSNMKIKLNTGKVVTGTVTIDTRKGIATANVPGLPFFEVTRGFNDDDTTFEQQ